MERGAVQITTVRQLDGRFNEGLGRVALRLSFIVCYRGTKSWKERHSRWRRRGRDDLSFESRWLLTTTRYPLLACGVTGA